MAVADIYSVSSGMDVAIGRSILPAWVPALGTVVDISLNTPSALAGDTNIDRITRTWSGVAYAPWIGEYGQLFSAGGGHTDGRENGHYGYDIGTRLWWLAKNSAAAFVATDTYCADPATGWLWTSSAATDVQVGQPFTSHYYSFLIAIPPSALTGSASGWLYTPGRGSMADSAQRNTPQAHKFSLDQSNPATAVWQLSGAPLLRGPGHGCAIHDTSRNRIVQISDAHGSAQTVHPYMNLATETPGTFTTPSQVDGNYAVGGYHSTADCYLINRCVSGSTLYMRVIDAATNQVYAPSTTGTAPTGSSPYENKEGAWDWVPQWDAWVYYPGLGGNDIYTLKAPSNPRTGTWTWAKQTVTGVARSRFVDVNGGGTPYNRLRYCAGIKSVIWYPDYSMPVQAFRISPP